MISSSLIFRRILAIISIIEAIFIGLAKTPRIGLEELFWVPLLYGFCILFIGRWIGSRIGLGLRIFFLISIMRYLVQPILIVMSNGELNNRMPNANPNSYRIAIVIYIIELLVSFTTIFVFYYKDTIKTKRKYLFQVSSYSINTIGWIVIFAFAIVLFVRLNIWLPELKILGLKESSVDKGIVLDASLFNSLKGFIFIYFLAKSVFLKSDLYLIMAILTGLFNFLSYFGANRSFIFETALATIVLFSYTYSRYKKIIYSFFFPFAAIIFIFMFVTKQFGVDDVSDYEAGTKTDMIISYSNILEEYVNGFWTVARSYQAAIGLPVELSWSALIKDIMDGLSSLRDIPFLKTQIFPLTEYMLSSSDIFKLSLKTYDYEQMLSFSGGFFIVFGTIFGWPAMILGNYLIIRLLIRIDCYSVFCPNLYYRYIYIWMSCLLGLIHCYCMQTIIFCWSKYILFIQLILFANNFYSSIIKKYVR